MEHQTFNCVWDALESDPIKRENLRLRAQLMRTIITHIKDKKLTHKKVAKCLNISQARVNNLMNENLHDFRIDTLINFANRLGLLVSLDIGHFQSASMA